MQDISYKKKILHLVIGLDVGGTESMLARLLPLLQNDDLDNRVCCISGHGIVGEKLEQCGVKVSYLDFRNKLDLGVIFRFKKVINDFKPDILVTYLIHADLFGRIFGRLLGIKTIVCSQRGSLLNWEWLRLIDRWTSFLVNKYIVQTEVAKEKLMKKLKLSENKFVVIPNGISLNEYKFDLGIEKKKRELGVDLNNLNIICVSNLRIGKGHKYLLKAFEKIYESYKNINLLVVGDGDQKRSLLNQINNYSSKKNIFFLGQRDDVKELLRISNIFVLATEGEGMSNAILEAMASKLPIVTTNIEENKEIIKDGKTGLLVPQKSVVCLVNSIIKLIGDKNLRDTYGKNAFQSVLTKFEINTIVKNQSLFFKSI